MYKQKEKMKQNKILKGSKGITLIALVITIIVLLILAAISIATLTGDNGILNQAQRAKEKTKIATEEEQRQLAMAEAATNLEDTKYQGITIPAGMAPTRIEGENTVKEGLVAIDKNGNEWVWIEVPEIAMSEVNISFKDETGYSEGDEGACRELTTKLKEYVSSYSDTQYVDKWYANTAEGGIVTEETANGQDQLNNGCGLTLKEYKETYQKMIKSIYKNKGFWIGRYEAGIEGSTGTDEKSLSLIRTVEDRGHTDNGAICQKDAMIYSNVSCREAQELAQQMKPDGTMTSSLLFGIQWDLVCKYLEEKGDLAAEAIKIDSGSWGNYKDQPIEINSRNAKGVSAATLSVIPKGEIVTNTYLSAGASYTTKRLNIYDLAGNEWEWTMECSISNDLVYPCVIRGGNIAKDRFGVAGELEIG